MTSTKENRSAQSELRRGPRRGAVAHVRRTVPHWLQWSAQIRPQKYPLSVDRSPNPTTCLIPGPVQPTMPNGIRIRYAVFPQCTGQTDRRPTDRPRESLTTIGRYATRVTLPKKRIKLYFLKVRCVLVAVYLTTVPNDHYCRAWRLPIGLLCKKVSSSLKHFCARFSRRM